MKTIIIEDEQFAAKRLEKMIAEEIGRAHV